jgi:hypothetical protein
MTHSFTSQKHLKRQNCVVQVIKAYGGRRGIPLYILSLSKRERGAISCRPRLLAAGKYELRPNVTASSVSVASWVFNPKHTSCVPRLVRNCISCIERQGCTKCPTIGWFLHSFIVFCFKHNCMHTYRIVEWYRQHSCYITLRSSVYTLLKNLVGEEDRHIVFLISPISS